MSLFATLEATLRFKGLLVKQSLADFCDLESLYDTHDFITRQGGLATHWRYLGLLRFVHPRSPQFDALCGAIEQTLTACMRQHWHGLDLVFVRDPSRTEDEIKRHLQRLQRSCDALKLDLSDLLAARLRTLSRRCVFEDQFITLWSRPSQLTPPQVRAADRALRQRAKQLPTALEAQHPEFLYADLVAGHRGMVEVLNQQWLAAGLLTQPLTGHEFLSAVRQLLDPSRSDPAWRPCLPGDRLPIRAINRISRDWSDWGYPTIAGQLFFDDIVRDERDAATVPYGSLLYSSVYIERTPETIAPFTDLFTTLRQELGLPYRIAFKLDGDGLHGSSIKQVMAAMLRITTAMNQTNKMMVQAFKQLRSLREEGGADCRLQITATTWATDRATLNHRRNHLARALEAWGGCDVQLDRGDPTESFLASLPGITDSSPATRTHGPLDDVVRLLPWTRAASPWRDGAVLLRSEDGKPYPWQPGSALQPFWTELYLGPQGSGKSLQMHLATLASVLSAGSKLPFLGGLDFGGSARWLMCLIQSGLRPGDQDQVLYRRLRKSELDAINGFDTQLGCRQPLPHELSFQQNLLTLWGTPITGQQADEGVAEVALMVLSETFERLSDDTHGFLKRYDETVSDDINSALERHRLRVDNSATWWQLVDDFFAAGDIAAALRAQRYAVPTLDDMIHTLNISEIIKRRWGSKQTTSGERLLDALSRQWRSAAAQFPQFAKPTALDTGAARMIVLDLEEIAPRGGPVAERETAVAFMLGRYVTANIHFLHPDHLPLIPAQYHAYHADRIREIRETPKRWFADEVHRATHGGEATVIQIETDNLEARKRDVQYALSTQNLFHISDDLISNSSTRVLLGAGDEMAAEDLTARFRLNADEQAIIRHKLNGPTPAGAPMLMQCLTRFGLVTQYLIQSSPPEELWGLSTVSEDSALRQRLEARLTPPQARLAATLRFPDGSCKGEVERRRHQLAQTSRLSQETQSSILDDIAEEIFTLFEHYQLDQARERMEA